MYLLDDNSMTGEPQRKISPIGIRTQMQLTPIFPDKALAAYLGIGTVVVEWMESKRRKL